MLKKEDAVFVSLEDRDIQDCIEIASKLCKSMIDRRDLHTRSYMERYIDILMGEVAERAVIKWLTSKGKYAVSAVNKDAAAPDLGHDINVRSTSGKSLRCSVKSSLSVYKSNVDDIIHNFTLASKKSELREINVQVYFWLALSGPSNRVTVPSNLNMAIIGWASEQDMQRSQFSSYNHEQRQCPGLKLSQIRSMESLLQYLE